MRQETIVNKKVYSYSDNVDQTFSDANNNYFPLQKSIKSMMYSNLDNKEKRFVNIMEVMYGIDEVEIEDVLI